MRRLARLLPAAFAIHVAEEAPGFTAWAQRHASPRYSRRDFAVNNAVGFAGTVMATGVLARTRAAVGEGLLSRRDVALCVAGAGPMLVVAEQVYLATPLSARR